jgi:hypothetical protein
LPRAAFGAFLRVEEWGPAMALDDFTILTEQDKSKAAYGLCVLGVAATGATFGSLVGGQTVLGFVGGGVMGLFLCKWIEQPLKQKLFSAQRMTEREFQALAAQTKREYPQLTRNQVLELLAAARRAAIGDPRRYRC